VFSFFKGIFLSLLEYLFYKYIFYKRVIKLNVRRNKELEIKIVNLTEELIQNILKASLKDEDEKTFILEDSQNLILELSGLIHALIQNEEHLESMLNQLVFQKLPGDHILDSFEDFKEVLAELIQKGVNKYRFNLNEYHTQGKAYEEKISNKIKGKNAPEEQVLKCQKSISPNNALVHNKQESDKLIIQIKRIFPGITVKKDVHYKGAKLQYYIPQMKIVLDLESKENFKKAKGLKDLITEKEGLRIVKVSPDCSLSKLKKFIKVY